MPLLLLSSLCFRLLSSSFAAGGGPALYLSLLFAFSLAFASLFFRLFVFFFPHPAADASPNQVRWLSIRTLTAVLLKIGISDHLPTTFSPSSHHDFSTFFPSYFRGSHLAISRDNRNKPRQNLSDRKTHHNSPQTPKTCFIHSKVVRPPLLTLPLPETPTLQTSVALKGIDPKKKAPSSKGWGLRICRRSPNLPHTYACSTIGPTRLNFRVRDGNGCDPRSKLTGKLLKSRSRDLPQLNRLGVDVSTFESSL
jgi:hypothetical protein